MLLPILVMAASKLKIQRWLGQFDPSTALVPGTRAPPMLVRRRFPFDLFLLCSLSVCQEASGSGDSGPAPA